MSNLTLREAFTNHKFILVEEMLKENPSKTSTIGIKAI